MAVIGANTRRPVETVGDVHSLMNCNRTALLRVSFPVAYGRLKLSEIISEFLDAYPKVKGDLVHLLPEWTSVPGAGIYVAHSSSKHLAPKVRVFSDFLVQKLKNVPWSFRPLHWPSAELHEQRGVR